MPKTAKTYYRIREVAALLDIPDYTIRFWEDEFPMFNPDRSPKGQRRFTPEQVELARRIKELLYDKGLKIDAAIKVLNDSYRKSMPRYAFSCKSPADAMRLLNAVKGALEVADAHVHAHAIARIEAVEGWIKEQGNTG